MNTKSKTLNPEQLKFMDESESRKLLASFNIPLPKEVVIHNAAEAEKGAKITGFPLVLKALGVAHKTEENAIITYINSIEHLGKALALLMEGGRIKEFLIQEMVEGKRELVIGFEQDELMGPYVMFGLGGIFTEILKDVTFRPAPVSHRDAMLMLKDIRAKKILDCVRGEPAADLEALAKIIMATGDLGTSRKDIKSIDINPVILRQSDPIAVDVLIQLFD